MKLAHHEADSEGRAARRMRTLKAGVISFAHGQCALPCTIRDITDNGARIEYTGTVPIPEVFRLLVRSDGVEAQCTVAWRHRSMIGVRFENGLQKSVSAAKRKGATAILEW